MDWCYVVRGGKSFSQKLISSVSNRCDKDDAVARDAASRKLCACPRRTSVGRELGERIIAN